MKKNCLTGSNDIILVVLDSAGGVERTLGPEAANDDKDGEEEQGAGHAESHYHGHPANTLGLG